MPYNYFWSTDSATGAYTSPDLEVEYNGFKITKDKDYGIFYIMAPLGKALDSMLQGGFTKMQLAKQHIDEFLKDHPMAGDAFEHKEAPPSHVGRPTKEETKGRRKAELEKKLAALLEELN